MSSSIVPPVRTRITSMLGCRYPLILPGMSWISTPELVAAVSNAGGIGILATGPLTPPQTRAAIHQIRKLAPTKPFGVGATLLMPNAEANARVAIEESVPLLNLSLGKSSDLTSQVHEYGGRVLSTVTTIQHATAAIEAGADGLMVTGYEAAAHGGEVGSVALVPSMTARFPEVPIVAAGGFADGRGVAAALALGAEGVAMGSRLATTRESPLACKVKERIADGEMTELDTLYSANFDGIPSRVMDTPAGRRAQSRPTPLPLVILRAFRSAREMGIPLWNVLPGLLTRWQTMYAVAQFGAATEAIRAATVEGDLEGRGVQFVGQSQGLIMDVPTVEELVQRIMREACLVSEETALKFRVGVEEGRDLDRFVDGV